MSSPGREEDQGGDLEVTISTDPEGKEEPGGALRGSRQGG